MKAKLFNYEIVLFNSSLSGAWISTKNCRWLYKALMLTIFITNLKNKIIMKSYRFRIPYWYIYQKDWRDYKKLQDAAYKIMEEHESNN